MRAPTFFALLSHSGGAFYRGALLYFIFLLRLPFSSPLNIDRTFQNRHELYLFVEYNF